MDGRIIPTNDPAVLHAVIGLLSEAWGERWKAANSKTATAELRGAEMATERLRELEKFRDFLVGKQPDRGSTPYKWGIM